MTAINDLVRKACVLDSNEGMESGLFQIAEAGEALYPLYASVYEIIEALLSLELLRIEFRMPAAPPAQEAPVEEKVPPPLPKEAGNVVVGPINVYAIAKDIQEALDRLGKETLDVTAAYAGYVPRESLPVIAPAIRIAEAQAVRPELRRQGYELKRAESSPMQARRAIMPERQEASKEASQYDKAPVKNAPSEAPMYKQAIEREIKRSVTMINELREVYDVLLANASAIALKSRAEEMPEPSPAAGYTPVIPAPSQPSITIPVPIVSPITPQATPGTPALQRPSATAPAPPIKPVTHKEEEARLHIVHKNVEVPLIKPIIKAPPTAEESAANARMISEAIAKSSAPVASPEPPLSTPAPLKKPAQPAMPAMMAVGPMVSPVQTARALSTVYSTVYRTIHVMEGYARMAAGISRAAGDVAAGGMATHAETPITKLLYAASSPMASPISHLNMPLNTGQIETFAPASGVGATEPAINLVMGIAASRAMQSAGGSAINNFISVMPSLGSGGLQGAIPVERMGAGPINIHVPPANVERGPEAGAVNKVSNFHNTFNITVSVKGGSDDGDLRDLGRKIGRILSDEIKRYGGI